MKGISGSLTPGSLYTILRVGDVYGLNFLDFGAGDGKAIAAAMAEGANSGHGFELPENQANEFIFKAAMIQIKKLIDSESSFSRVRVEFKDIHQVCDQILLLIEQRQQPV